MDIQQFGKSIENNKNVHTNTENKTYNFRRKRKDAICYRLANTLGKGITVTVNCNCNGLLNK